MKILYVCADPGIPVLGRKGASVHVRQLVAAFSRAEHQVVLAAATRTKSPWDQPEPFEEPLVHVRVGPETATATHALKEFAQTVGVADSLPGELRRILYNRDLGADLKRRFQGDPPDVVYERASLYSTVGVFLARELGVPLLLELNAPLALEQSAYRGTGLGDLAEVAERWTLGGADAVLCVSDELRDYVVALGVESSRVHVVPNGVDDTLFRPGPQDPDVRGRLGLDAGPVLGFVGGLRPWHGVEALPQLLERLVGRYPGLRLVVAGDGALRAPLERDFADRRLTQSVEFTGSLLHEEVPGVVRQFDAALAPYPPPNGHPFYFSPLKLFEYMACGVPVVAADLGQISSVIRDGHTGLLYAAGELDPLVAACDRLLADPGLRRRLGEAGSAEVRASYTWDGNAARIVDLARSLIESRRLEP